MYGLLYTIVTDVKLASVIPLRALSLPISVTLGAQLPLFKQATYIVPAQIYADLFPQLSAYYLSTSSASCTHTQSHTFILFNFKIVIKFTPMPLNAIGLNEFVCV